MHGISMLVLKRVQVGVGRTARSIGSPYSPQETRTRPTTRPNHYATVLTRLESASGAVQPLLGKFSLAATSGPLMVWRYGADAATIYANLGRRFFQGAR